MGQRAAGSWGPGPQWIRLQRKEASLRERCWVGFVVCTLLGAAAAFGLLVFGVLGLFGVAFVVWVTSRPRLRSSASGLLAGVGAMSLMVAFIQRRGPGAFCSS